MGVPDPQIQLRMRNDGMDPDVLYDPSRLLPAPPDEPDAAPAPRSYAQTSPEVPTLYV